MTGMNRELVKVMLRGVLIAELVFLGKLLMFAVHVGVVP